jgi:DNA-binding NarL/FixJ family response regulator
VRRPRLLLADDHRLVLEGLERLLEPEFEVVGAVEDGRALLAAARALKPDVVLLDISMPLLNGIDAAHRLRKNCPASKLIFVTMHDARAYVKAAFEAGGSGYVLKRAALRELIIAIHEVLAGGTYVSPEIETNAGKPRRKILHQPVSPIYLLTPRQREVLQLVGEGRPNKEIAFLLGVSVKCVEYHKTALSQKLGTHNPAALTRYAASAGLIVPRLT